MFKRWQKTCVRNVRGELQCSKGCKNTCARNLRGDLQCSKGGKNTCARNLRGDLQCSKGDTILAHALALANISSHTCCTPLPGGFRTAAGWARTEPARSEVHFSGCWC